MNTISFNLGGKKFENIPVNNSGWLSPTGNQELIELCQAAPRVRLNSKGVPIIKDDSGVYLYLGASEYRHEDERHAPGSSASNRPDSKDSQEFKDAQSDWAKVMQEIDYSKYPALVAFMGIEDPRATAIKALMALGFSEAQAKAAIKAKEQTKATKK